MKKGLTHWNTGQKKIYRVKHGKMKRINNTEKSLRDIHIGHDERVNSQKEKR